MKSFTKFSFAALAAAAMATPAATSSAQSVVFDFVDNDGDAASQLVAAFDGGSNGASVVVDGLTLTVADIIGQNGTSNVNDGATHTVNIAGNQDALSVNDEGTGAITGGGDSSHFNPNESIIFTLDQAVTLTNIELESFTGGETVFQLITAAGTIDLADSDNPVSVSIAANESFQFLFASTTGDDQVRIESITATVVPEPASLALLAMGGLAIGARRKRI